MIDGALSAGLDEQSLEIENDEVLEFLDQHERNELKQIEEALFRIDNNTYTRCVSCGGLIEEKRLLAIPYTKMCLSCVNEQ